MKAILIDDEQLALTYQEYQLMLIGSIEIVGKYTDPLEGRRAVEEQDIDIVFLDINIPELSGIELAELLLERKPGVSVVFVTTYEEYAIKAFELNALDYVLKPVHMERLKKTVQRIQQYKALNVGQTVSNSRKWNMKLFGPFLLSDDQGMQISLRFRTTKAQELFFYLIYHRGKVVSKLILMDLLWPNFEFSKASSQLYTAVYHIRKTLEPLQDHIQLKNTAEGYMIQLEDIILDVDEFERLVELESSFTKETAEEYERKLTMLQGEYYEQFLFDWVEYERQRYQLQWMRLMMNLTNRYFKQAKYEKAFKVCDRLSSRYPLEEQVQLMYLKISDKLGYHFIVQQQYQLYKSRLEKEYHDMPGDEITEWYECWKKKY